MLVLRLSFVVALGLFLGAGTLGCEQPIAPEPTSPSAGVVTLTADPVLGSFRYRREPGYMYLPSDQARVGAMHFSWKDGSTLRKTSCANILGNKEIVTWDFNTQEAVCHLDMDFPVDWEITVFVGDVAKFDPAWVQSGKRGRMIFSRDVLLNHVVDNPDHSQHALFKVDAQRRIY